MSVGIEYPAIDRQLNPPAFEITGPADAPVVVVLGGISASRHVTSTDENPRAGWWEEFVGRDRTIDTDRFRVLSIDYISTDENGGPVTTHDQAVALEAVLDALCIESARAIVGASYGGMVALAFGAIGPHRVGQLVVIGAAHESSPMTTALRILQRRIVELGIRGGHPHDAVAIARGLAITTYSTAGELSERFHSDDQDPPETGRLIADFLFSSGEKFARSCPPERYLAISQSLDHHSVRPEDVHVPTTLIAVVEDTLVPISQVRDLARLLGGPSRLVELHSRYGHDTFLNDPDLLAPSVRRALSSLSLHES